jgi:hypothetical protein
VIDQHFSIVRNLSCPEKHHQIKITDPYQLYENGMLYVDFDEGFTEIEIFCLGNFVSHRVFLPTLQ